MKVDLRDIYVVIPALNEMTRIMKVINKLFELGFKHIVVIDDGSTDNTAGIIPKDKRVFVLKHLVNLGPGASTMTGIEFALHQNARYIATIDADHQHDPEDLIELVKEMETNNMDFVIGSRFLKDNEIPFTRRVYNKVGNWISYLKTGTLLSDSQSGIKIMSRKFAEKLYIDYNGFEFCIEMIKKAKLNQIYIGELPVSVQYNHETMSKGQSFWNGMMMLGKLLNPF